MFSEADQFYPTPKPLIRKMLAPYKNLSDKTILDPEAGKGDVVDFIMDEYRWHESVYCIEKNPDLIALLQGKKYRVLHNDFLTYSGDHCFDLIVMNPPFSNGDEHLLKAWDIMEHGDIVCLLNAVTVREPRTARRKLLKNIIDENGSIEYIESAFKTAERKTSVEIALVRLNKVSTKQRFDFFENANKTKEEKFEFDDSTINNLPARLDVIGNMVIQYQESKKAFVEYMRARDQLYFYASSLMPSGYSIGKALEDANEKSIRQYNRSSNEENLNLKKIEFNTFVDSLKVMSWKNIFNKTKLREKMTGKVIEDFDKYSEAQGCMDFTPENIENLFMMLMLNSSDIMKRCMVDVFEKMCSYDEKNRIHVEGWKTNDAYKVNRRVIMPYFIEYSNYGNGGSFSVSYRNGGYSALDDIDKVMCYISANKFEEVITMHDALKKAFVTKGIKIAESEFFKLKFFKKGTLHIEFKDRYLWEQFNISVARGKNWLPDENTKPKTKKKSKSK